MNKFLPLLLILFSTSLFAQPGNDNCDGIIDLGTAPFCENTTVYNNVGATQSDIGNDNIPFCFVDQPSRDVWFSFVSSDTILEYTISVIGCPDLINGYQPIINPEIAIYRGDVCGFDQMALLDCATTSSDPGSTEVEFNPPALTPGITYYVRVSDWSSTPVPNSGGFKVCVTPQAPIVTIDQGGSTACSGEIYDSGGMAGNYADNENFVYTICPQETHSCLNFALEFFHMDPDGDQLIFYDGPDISAPQIQILGAPDPFSQNGVSGGGAVCYNLFATSGCLTLQFISNSATNFEGFHGFWECSQEPCQDLIPIEVASTINDDIIVNSIADNQMTVTIDTIICDETQYGVFEGDNNDLGLEEGLLLTTGRVVNAFGPNNNIRINEAVGTPGDADLDALSAFTSNDACIVELDVFVPTDELTFEYIFGSEEYAEYVASNFNDIFAFLVSGPGITGQPELNGQENIAILPGTNIPVEINSVNNIDNWQYYRSNELDATNPLSPAGKSLQYDGLTSDFMGIKKSLTARKKVTPCDTYHLKLAIADRGDNSFDSGVFITEISGGTPTLAANFFSGINYLVEECTVVPDEVIVSIPLAETEPVTYDVTVGGTADNGTDYTLSIPSTLTFQPGETIFKFPITTLTDGIAEGVETIEISLSRDFGCGAFTYSTLVLEVRDELNVEIDLGADSTFVCAGQDVQLQATGANQYIWTPSAIFDDNQVSDPIADPTGNMWVVAEGALGICFDKDSIWLEYRDPSLDIVALGDTAFCQGEFVNLFANNNVQNTNLDWSPNTGLNDDEAQTVTASPRIPTTYFATVMLDGCEATDSIFIDVDEFEFPEIADNNPTICQNTSIQIAEPLFGATQYQWTPDDGTLNSTTISGPVASPIVTTTYTLVATSPNNYCQETASVTVDVIPINVEILNPDSVFICLGESVTLNSESSSDGVGQTWLPNAFLQVIDNENVEVSPEFTLMYTTTVEVGNCTHEDDVLVVVDSLPSMAISIIPDRSAYCVGDTITLLSPSFNPTDFPNMEFQWSPNQGWITPGTNPNMILEVTSDLTLTRAMSNRECSGDESIDIIVAQDFTLTADGTQNICPGEEITLNAFASANNVNFSWEKIGGASAGQGAQITVNPEVSTSYEVTAIDDNGCYIHTEIVDVNVVPTYTITGIDVFNGNGVQLDESNVVKGQQIELRVNTDSSLSGGTYEWFADGELFATTNEPSSGIFSVPDFSGDKTILYQVVVYDSGGCIGRADIAVDFTDDFSVSIPNIFSPNNNDINDRFTLLTEGESNISIVEFQVFNRWGQLVYDNENNFEGWDGTQNGKPAPADVYIYKIVYEVLGVPGETSASGEVTLLR